MTRAVPLTYEQFKTLESVGFGLMRAGDDTRATVLLGIALAWRVSPVVIDRYECHVDESAGLADTHSRRVPDPPVLRAVPDERELA